MCGIAGIVHWDDSELDLEELRHFTNRMAHRGPDGEGQCSFRRAALGHRRLAIIDLAGGTQPLANEDETIWITFNGEIYNFRELRGDLERLGHVFRTSSDTEVIVHAYEAWGDQCVDRLRGMFAFGLWDDRRQRLLLARDRLGVKPLVYWWHGQRLYFASEVQAFQALNRPPCDVDLAALDHYLELLYVPSPYVIYDGMRKLPPGHRLVLSSNSGPVVQRYWSLPSADAGSISDREWLDHLATTLTESVGLHLIADVEVGAFLSSGIDSSLVAALARQQHTGNLKTYTVGFLDEEFDESAEARVVAQYLGTEHHEHCSELDVCGLLPAVVAHHGEPFADSSALPMYAICAAARRDVKVMLSGDGGDEGFAGYPWVHGLVRAFDGPDVDWKAGTRRRLRRLLGALSICRGHTSPLPTLRHGRSCFSSDLRKTLWRSDCRKRIGAAPLHAMRPTDGIGWGTAHAVAQNYDFQAYLPDDVLTKVDIASMAHGLEVRVPLLDHHVVELAVQMPVHLKLQLTRDPRTDAIRSKVALRSLLRQHLPAEVSDRPKKGFGLPLHRWFAENDPAWLSQRLLGKSSRLLELFNRPALEAIACDFSRAGASRKWSLVVLAEWFRQNPHVRWPMA